MNDNFIFILSVIGLINFIVFMTIGVNLFVTMSSESKNISFKYLIIKIQEIYKELTVFGIIVFSMFIIIFIPSIILWYVILLVYILSGIIVKLSFKKE